MSYRERLYKEYSEIDDRVFKLTQFAKEENPIFKQLDIDSKYLLLTQLKAMETYKSILWLRLDQLSRN